MNIADLNYAQLGAPQQWGSYQDGGQLDHSLEGFAAARTRATTAHNRRISEAARLYADCLEGRLEPIFMREAIQPRNEVFVRHLMEKYPGIYGDPGGRMLGLRETMSVTDYQALFVDVLDRLYYGYYSMWPINVKQIVKIVALRDFRTVKRYLLDALVKPITYRDAAEPWNQQALRGPTPQNAANPPTSSTSTAALTYQPLLGQTGAAINWRAFVNDDLGIFQDVANRLSIAANRGIAKFISSLFWAAGGLNTSLFASGYNNLISGNPALGIEGLSDGFDLLFAMTDSEGEPIMVADSKIYLVYGPSNEVTAQNLGHMLNVYIQNRGGGTQGTSGFPAQFLNTTNWLMERVTPVMDPYLPIIASSNKGMWALVIDPKTTARPAVEVGFLNGETPQLFQKVPNTQRMGGGVDPMMGDFYSMDQETKIVSVIGGTQIDGRTVVGSNGSGA